MQSFEKPTSNPVETFTHLAELNKTPLHERGTQEKHKIAEETFLFFKEFLQQYSFAEYTNLNEAYTHLENRNYIVRREDPRNIFPLLSKDAGYTIDFESDRYANCVIWNPQTDGPKGIYNAYMEGFTNMNSIVTVIGFKTDTNDDLLKMDDSTENFYGLDRSRVRSYKGSVTKDRIAFINLRIPGHLLSEQHLAEDEIDRVDEYLEAKEQGKEAKPVMIHRSYLAPNP